jgi:hypothetical protein
MGRLSAKAEEKLRSDLARAAAAGHDVDRLELVPRGTSGTNHGTRAVCTCGWISTPRGRKTIAALAGLFHAQEVCRVLDERGRLDGVEWSAAPNSSALHHQSAKRSREDAQGVSRVS